MGFQGNLGLSRECFPHILGGFSDSRNGGEQTWILHQF